MDLGAIYVIGGMVTVAVLGVAISYTGDRDVGLFQATIGGLLWPVILPLLIGYAIGAAVRKK